MKSALRGSYTTPDTNPSPLKRYSQHSYNVRTSIASGAFAYRLLPEGAPCPCGTRVEWRDRWSVDTVNTGRIDSVRVTEVVEVPAKLTAWQACQLKAFAPLVAIAVLLLAWVTRRL